MSGVAEVAQHLPTAAGWAQNLLTGALSAGGGGALGAGGVWAFLSERSKSRASAPAQMTQSLATFQAALNDQAKGLIQSFRQEVDELRSRVADLERENETCRSENSEAKARIDTLEGTLRREGIEVPARPPVANPINRPIAGGQAARTEIAV